uniref:methylcrotonoyl-CoA carboxylase n=1 Tax=Xiphophorus couchianus TaxID=32473 RepID=A0A3B5LSJ4_9TELE
EKVRRGGGENAVIRHTQRNRKLLVRDRLRFLLDDDDFLELSPFAGMGLPYGDIPSAGCLTGVGRINGLWCVFIANDATVKGGTAYPITVKKQLRAQEVVIQNRLPCVYLVDSGGAFLPLQSEIFPDKNQGGRTFYNEAIMSAMKIPQVLNLNIIAFLFPAQIVSRLTDGSRFQEFKGRYGTTLVTGFAKIHGHLVGIVANNGALTYEAALKGSHFVQLCDQRDAPLLFLQNTAPAAAQGSMMSAVACASVPKITVVIGGCHGGDSYAMCGRAFDPNFLFLWPNARVSLAAPGHADSLLPADTKQEEEKKLNEKLEEESSAFFSSGRMWDDGVILPQETRKVKILNYHIN